MTQTAEVFMAVDAPMVRSSIYRLLAAAFRYPNPKLFEVYKNGAFLMELWQSMLQLPHLRQLADETAELQMQSEKDLAGTTFREFEVGYTQTFDVGAPKPPCPPYEGIHRQGVDRTHLLVEISEIYKHFGLGMSDEEGKRELPDHLSAELELLHFLTFKEAQAEDEETPELLEGYVLAQKDFLVRHIVSWLPSFFDKLRRSARVPLYTDLARITWKFTEADLEWTRSRLQELELP